MNGYTKAQLAAIMDKDGTGFVPRDKLPYAGRVAQTLLNKRVYMWEDKAALAEYRLIQTAYTDIRAYGLDRAGIRGLTQFTLDAPSQAWKREVLDYTQQRLRRLAGDIALSAYQYANTAYLAGYYGRLWQLSVTSTRKPVFQRLAPALVGHQVLHPVLKEIEADAGVYYAEGHDWREKYQTIFNDAYSKISRSLNTVQTQGVSILSALQGIGIPLGVTTKPTRKTSAAYYYAQSETRTAVLRSANQGGIAALLLQTGRLQEATDGWLLAVMWITAMDDRVCNICAPHSGQVFALNDLTGIAALGLPPDSTHYGCRCSYIPLILPEFWNEDTTAPPDMTWDDWLMGYDVEQDLAEFMKDKRLRSAVA